jgi:hypothetical protein
MKLVIEGRAGQRVCDWESYALLRDNAQHFIESGTSSARFCALHEIERAVDCGERVVDAARLRGEVLRAWIALWHVPLEDAAVSLRTRAILTRSRRLPSRRGTVVAAHVGWGVPLAGPSASPLPRVAARFIRAVLALTESSVDGDALRVRCVKQRPQVAPTASAAATTDGGAP